MFAELKDPVRKKIDRYGLARAIEPRHFFPTIGAAVAAYRSRTGAQWAPAGPSESEREPLDRRVEDAVPPPDVTARPPAE